MEFRPMSPEEIERTVQFLLTQQAQFAADLERLGKKTDGMADAIIGLTAVAGRTIESVGQLTALHAELAGKLQQLADAQERTDAQLKDTDTRLNVVMDMFERHLREGHGPTPS